jgi:hypothetical protein
MSLTDAEIGIIVIAVIVIIVFLIIMYGAAQYTTSLYLESKAKEAENDFFDNCSEIELSDEPQECCLGNPKAVQDAPKKITDYKLTSEDFLGFPEYNKPHERVLLVRIVKLSNELAKVKKGQIAKVLVRDFGEEGIYLLKDVMPAEDHFKIPKYVAHYRISAEDFVTLRILSDSEMSQKEIEQNNSFMEHLRRQKAMHDEYYERIK